MNTMQAFANGEANKNKPLMVFDWDKAAKIIKERNVKNARAGLRSDWEWTGGVILQNNVPNKSSYTYLASTWAIPELEIDGETLDCWCWQSEHPNWDSNTKWPQSALDILTKQI